MTAHANATTRNIKPRATTRRRNGVVAGVLLVASLCVALSPGAYAFGIEDNAGNGRYKIDPGLLRTTVSFNKAETRAISRNGGYVAAATGAGAPGWFRLLGVVAAVIDNAADNAVASSRCLKITKYGLVTGAGFVLPGSYACR